MKHSGKKRASYFALLRVKVVSEFSEFLIYETDCTVVYLTMFNKFFGLSKVCVSVCLEHWLHVNSNPASLCPLFMNKPIQIELIKNGYF